MHAQGETISVGVDTGSIETDRITFEFTAPGCQGHRRGSAQQLGPSQPVDPQLFEESTLHEVTWRPLQNCDLPGVVSVREVDCDGRVFIVFDGGTMTIHPLLACSQPLRCRLRHTALVCRR